MFASRGVPALALTNEGVAWVCPTCSSLNRQHFQLRSAARCSDAPHCTVAPLQAADCAMKRGGWSKIAPKPGAVNGPGVGYISYVPVIDSREARVTAAELNDVRLNAPLRASLRRSSACVTSSLLLDLVRDGFGRAAPDGERCSYCRLALKLYEYRTSTWYQYSYRSCGCVDLIPCPLNPFESAAQLPRAMRWQADKDAADP